VMASFFAQYTHGGYDVNDDNEPSPKNTPTEAASHEHAMYVECNFAGICQRHAEKHGFEAACLHPQLVCHAAIRLFLVSDTFFLFFSLFFSLLFSLNHDLPLSLSVFLYLSFFCPHSYSLCWMRDPTTEAIAHRPFCFPFLSRSLTLGFPFLAL
jgi:hypothetical protein